MENGICGQICISFDFSELFTLERSKCISILGFRMFVNMEPDPVLSKLTICVL